MSADDVQFFFEMRSQVKLYHWQTGRFSRHKATDDVLEALDKLIDEYVETYMGKYGRPKMTGRNSGIKVMNMADSTAARYIRACIAHIQGQLTRRLKPTDTDLFNLRDEMLGELNKLLYLYTLR